MFYRYLVFPFSLKIVIEKVSLGVQLQLTQIKAEKILFRVWKYLDSLGKDLHGLKFKNFPLKFRFHRTVVKYITF